jgi:hypothetical protein
MTLKRVLFYALIAFVIFFVIQSPEAAGKIVKATGDNAGRWVSTAAHAFARFIKSLTA